jgi:hypothetical protein
MNGTDQCCGSGSRIWFFTPWIWYLDPGWIFFGSRIPAPDPFFGWNFLTLSSESLLCYHYETELLLNLSPKTVSSKKKVIFPSLPPFLFRKYCRIRDPGWENSQIQIRDQTSRIRNTGTDIYLNRRDISISTQLGAGCFSETHAHRCTGYRVKWTCTFSGALKVEHGADDVAILLEDDRLLAPHVGRWEDQTTIVGQDVGQRGPAINQLNQLQLPPWQSSACWQGRGSDNHSLAGCGTERPYNQSVTTATFTRCHMLAGDRIRQPRPDRMWDREALQSIS